MGVYMKYRELMKRVQHLSGFSDKESKEALNATVEVIAVRLTDDERKDFASQLPTELQDIALTVRATEDNTKQDIVEQIVKTQSVTKARAKKQLLSAWTAIKEAISPGEIDDIRAQLPKRTASLLR